MGKKREIVQVDEEKLKMMMAGDIPIKADPEKDLVISEISTDSQVPDKTPVVFSGKQETSGVLSGKNTDESDDADMGKISKRKKNKPVYSETFLYKPAQAPRRQSTILIDETNYQNISRILKATNNFSIANFINNVLTNHFDQYQEEIDETLRSFFDNLYKK